MRRSGVCKCVGVQCMGVWVWVLGVSVRLIDDVVHVRVPCLWIQLPGTNVMRELRIVSSKPDIDSLSAESIGTHRPSLK